MERWLRHEIATRMDIAAGLAFPFPRQVLAGAAGWLRTADLEPDAAFWKIVPSAKDEAERWERESLAFRLVVLLRGHLAETDFEAVKGLYLRFIFEKLPMAETLQDYEDLLPWNVDPKQMDFSQAVQCG